jgi:hypothetical protein
MVYNMQCAKSKAREQPSMWHTSCVVTLLISNEFYLITISNNDLELVTIPNNDLELVTIANNDLKLVTIWN